MRILKEKDGKEIGSVIAIMKPPAYCGQFTLSHEATFGSFPRDAAVTFRIDQGQVEVGDILNAKGIRFLVQSVTGNEAKCVLQA